MEQRGAENVFALFSAKYNNFCARFAEEFERVGATAPSIDAVLNGLTLAKPYHALLRAHDKNSIVELLGISDFAHAPRVVAELQAMQPEKEELLWRYVDFFLDCLAEL